MRTNSVKIPRIGAFCSSAFTPRLGDSELSLRSARERWQGKGPLSSSSYQTILAGPTFAELVIAISRNGDLQQRDSVTVDLTTLPTGLIAIVGPNGAGKTTIVDNLHPYPIMPGHAAKMSADAFS